MSDHEELDESLPLPEFDSDALQEPMKIDAIKEDMGMPVNQIKAAELVGETFVIRRARAFVSSYQQGHTAYYCECVKPETGEIFSTVLGGQGVVDLLDLYVQSGKKAPLQVTLKLVKGGRFGRYYVLE